MKKRILSLLLAMVMLVGMIPATTLTAFAESGEVAESGKAIVGIEGLGTPDNPYLIVDRAQWTILFGNPDAGKSGSGFDGQYVKLCTDIATDDIEFRAEISEDTHLDLNVRTSEGISAYGEGCVVEVTGSGAAKLGSTYGATLILNDTVDFLDPMYLRAGTVILNSSSAEGEVSIVTLNSLNTTLILKQGTVTNLLISSLSGPGDADVFMYGGRLEDEFFRETGYAEAAQINFAFYGGVIAPYEVSQDKDKYYDLNEVEYNVTNTSCAFSKDGTTKKIASYDDLVDAIVSYGEFDVYAPYFAEQYPEMPAGQTTHYLGKVSASEYVMTFASQDTPSFIGASGCKVIEQLVVYDSNGEIVDTVTNNPAINGTGISYPLKNLPSGNYTIRETIALYDKDGKALLGTNNDFILEVDSTVNNINVSATFSGTPADATTSTTGATVTATKWYKQNGSSWTELSASDTIKEGNTYRCEVTVATTDGYPLADDYTVKINGTAATKKSGNTWYVDRTITGYRDYVDITDIPLPEKGAKPDFNTYDIQSGYTNFGMIEWYKCDKDGKIIGDALTEDDVFEADSYYRLEVTVVPYENYLFDTTNLSFFINLKAVNYYYPHKDKYPNSVTGWKVYHVDDANGTYTIQIGDITLKDGDYLANNATSVTTVKPVGGYAYYKDGVLTLNNFVAAKLVRYYERYLEVELIGENKIGAIADYYYWGGNASNNYYTGLEFRGDGNLELAGAYKPYSNISVNGDVFFNGSGDILLDAEICCFQYTENVIINDGYVYCHTSQDSVFMGSTIIEVNGGKLQMFDGGSWNDFTCNGTLTIAAGSVYVSADPSKTELADCVPWDGVTDLNTYDCVWIVDEQATVTHTVTFKVDTTTVATKTVENGKTVTAPADPTQSGKTFLGWYTDGGTKFDFTTPITGDITLTAKFEDATSTVKLGDVDGNGKINMGDVTAIRKYLIDATSYPLPVPEAADVTGEGKINMADVTAIRKYLINSSLYPLA